MEVPEVLLNGDHAKIAAWRREQSLLATARFRPDLLAGAELTKKDRAFLSEQGFDVPEAFPPDKEA